jgi:alpha-1,2-mannosyltransferase
LYADSGSTVGFVGPPVQALMFLPLLPFAAAGPLLARLVWYAINLALLWYGVTRWATVLGREQPLRWVDSAGALTPGARDALWALAAVAFPLQTQFEHQNLNLILLASSGWAACAFADGRPGAAGVPLGLAAALKVYPGIAVAWLMVVRSWRALGTAVLTVFVVSLLPVLVVGWSRFLSEMDAWRGIASMGWTARRANQSIVAMSGRYLLPEGPAGYPMVTWTNTAVIWCSAATLIVLWALLLVFTARRAAHDRVPEQLACVVAAASITPPIVWEHYFVAWFPVLLALRVRRRDDSSRVAMWAFWVGAISFTALSRPMLGPAGAQIIRDLSLMTWGGIVTCLALAVTSRRISSRRTNERPAPPTYAAGAGLRGTSCS